MRGRAKTSEQKREIIERLFRAWEKSPEQRLGQLISNALPQDFFYVEDSHFIETIERTRRAIDARGKATP